MVLFLSMKNKWMVKKTSDWMVIKNYKSFIIKTWMIKHPYRLINNDLWLNMWIDSQVSFHHIVFEMNGKGLEGKGYKYDQSA